MKHLIIFFCLNFVLSVSLSALLHISWGYDSDIRTLEFWILNTISTALCYFISKKLL